MTSRIGALLCALFSLLLVSAPARAQDAPPAAPTVTTGSAHVLPSGEVVVEGTVNPNGTSVDYCRFEYDTTIPYGYTKSCEVAVGNGTSPVAVRATLQGNPPGTTLHYRLVVDGAAGTVNGADQVFTVPSAPPSGGGSGSGPGGSGGGSGSGGSGGGSGSGGASDSGGAAAGRLSLPASVKVKAGKAALRLRCTGAAACRGTLSLKAKVKQGGRTKTISVGRASVNVAAGASRTVTVRLSNAARTALRRSHRLTVSVTGAGVTRRITLRG